MRIKKKKKRVELEWNGIDQILSEHITQSKDKGYFWKLLLQLVCICVSVYLWLYVHT